MKHDLPGAEQELKQALEEAAHFGQSSGPVATSLLNLAQLYRRSGRLAEAEPLLVRAADVLEQTAGPNNKVRPVSPWLSPTRLLPLPHTGADPHAW